MSPLRRLISEMHRRSIWQVLGIYLVGAWAAYQVVLSLVDGLGLPGWVPPLAITLFVIGLPIVLATAFVQEGLPRAPHDARAAGGAESERHTDAPEPGSQTAATGDGASSPIAATAPSGGTAERHGLRSALTWRRAITAGVLAFAALGLGVTGFMGMRALGIGPAGSLAARGELGRRDPILVEDFGSATGDSTLARVVAEAFRVDLSQSRFMSLVDRSRIRYALERMGRPDSTRMRGGVAREVAIRLGLKALVEGDVSNAAGAYVLTASLVTPDSGRVLASFRETARDSTQLMPALDRLTARMREKAGESLKTIRANPPLTQVTTTSLPALRDYMRARLAANAGHQQRANGLFREALALDPHFASAHRALAVWFYNTGLHADSMLYHLRAAVAEKDRLTEQERRHAVAMLDLVTGRFDAAQSEYEALLARDSTDATALVNLSVVYSETRQTARSEAVLRRAADQEMSDLPTIYWNLVDTELTLGRLQQADSTVREGAEHLPQSDAPYLRWRIAMARGDFAAADSLVRQHPGWRGPRDILDLTRGKVARVLASLQTGEDNRCGVVCATLRSEAELWVRGDTSAAARRAGTVLHSAALDSVDAADRPYGRLALILAESGRVAEARDALRRSRGATPAAVQWMRAPLLLAVRGIIDAHEGRLQDAVTELRRAQSRADCRACLGVLRGQVFEAASMPDSALAAYEAYIQTPWSDRFEEGPRYRYPNDPLVLARAEERAAMLADRLGKRRIARLYYARFVQLWKNADASLQPRVRAAERRLRQLSAAAG